MKKSTKPRTTPAAEREPSRISPVLSLEDQVLVELRRIIRATQMSAKQLAREAGLSTSQLVLLELLRSNTRMTAGQIARAMNLTQATVTTLLDRLQARGLVARERGDHDRRTVHVQITPAGQDRLDHAPRSLQQRFTEGFARLETWEKTAVLSSLQRLSSLMDVAALDAAPLLEVGSIDRAAEAADRDV